MSIIGWWHLKGMSHEIYKVPKNGITRKAFMDVLEGSPSTFLFRSRLVIGIHGNWYIVGRNGAYYLYQRLALKGL
jgi:hypothetical protein